MSAYLTLKPGSVDLDDLEAFVKRARALHAPGDEPIIDLVEPVRVRVDVARKRLPPAVPKDKPAVDARPRQRKRS